MLIYSHNPLSQGAKRLAHELGIRRIRHQNSRFKGLRRPWVINWGASAIPLPWGERVRILNAPRYVWTTSNKLTFFQLMAANIPLDEMITPPWTNDMESAQEWQDDGYMVVERHILRGSMGRGIRLVGEGEELHKARLYTQYIKKAAEYRIHIFDGEIIDCQRKVKREAEQHPNWKIRTHANGFIYQRGGLQFQSDDILDAAERAMEASGLLFGAVDVIWNEKRQKAYVLEINTAPGLEGQTVLSYANAFRRN